MSDPKPRRHRKRFVPPPEPTDDMRAWLRNEGTIICELPDGSRRQLKDNPMAQELALMSDLSALIEHLCTKRANLVRQMAASPEHITQEQIRDLAWLQTALQAVEAEKRQAERNVLHEEV